MSDIEKTSGGHEEIEERAGVDDRGSTQHKASYERPRILSVELLEAVAATCSPPAPPFGKSVPVPCGTIGS